MSRRACLALGLSFLSMAAQAQGVFTNATSPSAATCARVFREGYITFFRDGANATTTHYHQQGAWAIAPDERKSVANFTVYDEKGRGTSIASLKGKVVLVGLWSKNCDPSAKMLMEFAALYPKRAQFNFEVLAVNFDENHVSPGTTIEGGWRAVSAFKNKNKKFMEANALPFYLPGLGKEGPNNFVDEIYSLPALFLVDREGRLAQIHIGYKDGFVGETLIAGIKERPAAPPAPKP